MRTSAILILSVLLGFAGRPAAAGDLGTPTRCACCGCNACCVEKVCQVVCEVRKDVKTYWTVECHEMCPLLPGCCRDGCDGCPPPPRCGKPKCVKQLVKNQYLVDVPVYKCVVRYLCPACANAEPTGAASPTPAAVATSPAAPPPTVPSPSPTPSRVPR